MRIILSLFAIIGLEFFAYAKEKSSQFESLRPGNSIRIMSPDEPLLNGQFELDWTSEVNIPLCGNISFRGLDLPGAELSIKQCLRKFYKRTPHFELNEIEPKQFLIKLGWRNEKLAQLKTTRGTSIQAILLSSEINTGTDSILRLISPFGLDLVLPHDSPEWGKPFQWRGGESLILEKPHHSEEAYTIDVLGEVKKPGKLKFSSNHTILSVIREAQGLTPAADQDTITVIRTTNGSKIKSTWDDQKTKLEPGDVLYVPPQKENSFEKTMRWTGSLLAVINTFFLILLARKG